MLRLAEGVNRPEETLRDYVVTPELRPAYDDALSFIRSACKTKTSKASYLHGSFGSGKSHFMAVLHLILQGNTAARGIPELAAGHHQAQRLDHRQEVPARAVSHDRRPRHGVGHPRRLRRFHPPRSPRCADPRRLPRGGPVPRRREPAQADGRRPVLRHARGRFIGRQRVRRRGPAAWDAERFETRDRRRRRVRRNARSSSACSSASSSAPTTPRPGPTARHSSRSTRGCRSSASTPPASATTA